MAFVKIAEDQSIELLISGINMPDGVELAERACNFRDQLQIILVSGRDSNSHGFPLIRKPFLKSDLQRIMAEASGS